MKKMLSAFLPSIFLSLAFSLKVYADTPAAPPQPSGGMSMWQILQSGGIVLMILGLLSVLMMSLIIFLFLKLNEKRSIPPDLIKNVMPCLRQKKYDQAKSYCTESDSLFAGIISAGLEKISSGGIAAKESLEISARREVGSLWTALNYLSDIAQAAPMLGLLGTVLGMIQAFNNIAFDTGVVKPIVLAGGVAKAMITTASGLVVAIIAIVFYSILRHKVQYITNTIESTTSQVMEIMSHD